MRPTLTDLPVEDAIPQIREALATSGHAILQAEPGAGKTTIVPLRLLDEPWLGDQRIVVLEPRRLAARAAAARMAELLGTTVGDIVGYRTRDEHKTSAATRIEVITEGILTRRLQRDPSLPGTGLVVFDEIHERNLQTDLALALMLDARSALRPDLRLIAMSATLDVDRVAALLGPGEPAPVVTSEGRTHPIDMRWRPPAPREPIAKAAASAVRHALQVDGGDVLVFLAGAAEIRRTASLLSGDTLPGDVDVRRLFGALSRSEQDAALAPSPPGRRRVVLSTDIAETSLTVAGIGIVIDSGEVRTPRYDPRTGLTRLHTGSTSRASADQRAGRAGRLGPGAAYRLWSASDHGTRMAFAEPEIATVDLAGLALEVALWGARADDLSWLDPPPGRAMNDGLDLLVELGALDSDRRITPNGRAMAALPVHPRLAAMVVGSTGRRQRRMACALAAMIEERDVLRGHPDAVGADIADRVRLILDTDRTHPDADRDALRLVRRRARELTRRAGGDRRSADDEPDIGACGPVLARAYPDRIAQARGGGRFRLRHGSGASVPPTDALCGEAFLVIADIAGLAHTRGDRAQGRADQRIRMGASLDESDVEAIAGDAIEIVTSVTWDVGRNDLRRRTERRLDALVLAANEGPAEPGADTTAALVDRARTTGLAVLGWKPAARELQARIGFAADFEPDHWPDLRDETLAAEADDWLGPLLPGAVGRTDLERLDMGRVLRDRLGHHRLVELDRLVPVSVTLANGRTAPIDYTADGPAIRVRAQHLYGTTTHPTVANGRAPIVVTLLSPADRPIQVTADLPGFWAGSWVEVRKDMAGRYPKHDWPADPRNNRSGG